MFLKTRQSSVTNLAHAFWATRTCPPDVAALLCIFERFAQLPSELRNRFHQKWLLHFEALCIVPLVKSAVLIASQYRLVLLGRLLIEIEERRGLRRRLQNEPC